MGERVTGKEADICYTECTKKMSVVQSIRMKNGLFFWYTLYNALRGLPRYRVHLAATKSTFWNTRYL